MGVGTRHCLNCDSWDLYRTYQLTGEGTSPLRGRQFVRDLLSRLAMGSFIVVAIRRSLLQKRLCGAGKNDFYRSSIKRGFLSHLPTIGRGGISGGARCPAYKWRRDLYRTGFTMGILSQSLFAPLIPTYELTCRSSGAEGRTSIFLQLCRSSGARVPFDLR